MNLESKFVKYNKNEDNVLLADYIMKMMILKLMMKNNIQGNQYLLNIYYVLGTVSGFESVRG